MTGPAGPPSASAISDVKASVHELAYLAGREPGWHRAASGQPAVAVELVGVLCRVALPGVLLEISHGRDSPR